MAIVLTLTRIAPGTIASFGLPFPRGAVTETRQITAGGRELFITPTLYWHDAAGAIASIKAVRIQLAMPEDTLTITLSTTSPVPLDWPLASTPFTSVSHAVTHTRPVADYTITKTGSTYAVEGQNVRDLDMFECREPDVLVTFPDGYLASTGIFGPLLTADQVAADASLLGVKYLSDRLAQSVRSALFMDPWPASTTPSIGEYCYVTGDPVTDEIIWPNTSRYGGWRGTLAYWGLPLVTQVLFRTTGTGVLPAPLNTYTTYYSRDTADYSGTQGFKLSLEPDGVPIDLTDAGSGTFYIYFPHDCIQITEPWDTTDWPYPGAILPFEGFLYDRVATIYLSIAHSDEWDFLRTAHRYAWYYQSFVPLSGTWKGYWTGKPMDAGSYDLKYSHVRGLYYYYALTGDEGALSAIQAMAEMWRDHAWFTVPYRNGYIGGATTLWTERLLAAAFEGLIFGFFTTRDSSFLSAFLQVLTTAYTHISTQDQATLDVITKPSTVNTNEGMVLFNWPPQNAFVHNCYQARDGAGNTKNPWCSPWMTELIVAPLLEYQEMCGTDDRVDEIFIRFARFLRDTGLTYRTNAGVSNDTFLAPAVPYTTPGSRWLVPPYGCGRHQESHPRDIYNSVTNPLGVESAGYLLLGTRDIEAGYDDYQHCPDTTILTAAGVYGLSRSPDIAETGLAPFSTERGCDEAMHHEMSWKAKSNIDECDFWAYRDPSLPSGTHHAQGYLAAAYAGGPDGIWAYIQDHNLAWPRIRITPERKLSWWFNGSILQFGLMRASAFALPTIIQGWVSVPVEEPDSQVVYPGDDVDDGGWTGSVGNDLSSLVDEPDAPIDTDYITSPAYPVDAAAVMTLPGLNRPLPGDCVLTIRARKITPVAPGPLVFEEVTSRTGLPEILAAWYAERTAVDPYPGDPTKPYHWWIAAIAAGEFTGAGRPDIFVAHHGVPGAKLLIHTGVEVDGVPHWEDRTATSALVGSFSDMTADGSPYTLDANNDGFPDILTPTDEGVGRLAINDGTGRFSIQALDIHYSQLRLHDTTGDGWIDIVGILTGGDDFSVYTNDQDGTFTQTSSPGSGEWIHFDEAMRVSTMEYVGQVTFSNNAGLLQVNWPGTQMAANHQVRFRAGAGGALPGNLAPLTDYWVRDLNTGGVGTFRLALTQGGTALTFADAGTAIVECYGQLTYPSCRKVDMGGAIGEIVFVSFGEGYSFHEHPQQSYALRQVGGLWSDVTAELGLPTYRGFIAAIFDFNRNGYPDVLVTDSPLPGIYRNTGAASLVRQMDQIATDLSGAIRPEDTVCDVADFDEDGKVEILIQGYRFGYNSRLYHNQNDQYVRGFSPSSAVEQWVVADVNGDGRLDLIGVAAGTTAAPIGTIRVWLNRTPAAGNYLNVRLSGDTQNKIGIDAVVEAYVAGHLGEAAYLLTRVVNNTPGSPGHLSICGSGHSHGGKLPVHLGLGAAASVDVRVTYPSGHIDELEDVSTNATVTI